jgi:hypothetical protein
MCGGSTALFVYGYCFYYYYARSGMSGFMQTSFFFGYNLMVRGGCVCVWGGDGCGFLNLAMLQLNRTMLQI